MSKEVSTSDFREGMIARRLKGVKMILLVLSGKGGVGKSVVSAALAAILAKTGLAIGLLDADIYGPSSALLFGAHARPTEGEDGLSPPIVRGVKIMSVDLYAPGKPVPVTGTGSRDVIREMLALTSWGGLDYLIIDMPPATADIAMLFTSLRKKNLAAFVVTTPDKLSLAVAHRVMELLHSGKVPIAGVLGNMYRSHHVGSSTHDEDPQMLAAEFKAVFLGKLPYDAKVLSAVGKSNIEDLLRTRFGEALQQSVKAHVKL